MNHQASKFGQGDATASGSFTSHSNQPFSTGLKAQGQTRPQGFPGPLGHSQGQGHKSSEHGESANGALGTAGFQEHNTNEDRTGATNNRFGSGSSSGQLGFGGKQVQGSANRFSQSSSSHFGASNANRQLGQSGFASAQSQTNSLGSSASAQSSLGNRNEYLPPTNGFSHPQNGHPQSSRPQADSAPDGTIQYAQKVNNNVGDPGNFVALSQQKLQGQKQSQGTASTSYNQPISSVSGQSNLGTNAYSSQQPSSNNGRPSNRFSQDGHSSQASASFGSRKEYLPPNTGSNQNRLSNQPTASFGAASQFNQQSSQSTDTRSSSHQDTPSHSSFTSSSMATAGSQLAFGSKSNGFQKPQLTSNLRPSLSIGNDPFSSAQSSSGFKSQKATPQPQTELTTPFESTDDSSSAQSSQTSSSDKVSFGSRPTNERPSPSQFGNQFYPGLAASPTKPSPSALPSFGSQLASQSQSGSGSFGQTQAPAIPTQASRGQFNQQSQFGQYSQGVQIDDAQYSPSTQRPSISQQQHGPDDSYYYNQPSQPFNTPQSSGFASVPSNQNNLVNQGSAFAQSNSQFSNARQDIPSSLFAAQSGHSQGSSKYPRPPTVAPVGDVSSTSFVAQSGNRQGSSKYPRPPTVAPTAFASASTQSQYQSSGFNGITQASISPFPSLAPTQASQFNIESQFDSTPQTSNQFRQNSQRPLFGQQTAFAQSSFGSQSSPQPPKSREPSFQSQAQAQTFKQQDFNRNQPSDDTASPSVATQQHNGEIYDYTKPTQSLPAPEKTETASGQFGQKKQTQFSGQSRPQMGQDNENSQTSTNSQFSQVFPSKPEFGAQPSIPQFGQNNFAVQNSQQQFGSRHQFGQPARIPFGQTASAQATFGTQSTSAQAKAEVTQSQENTEGSKPQLGFGSPCCQSSKSSSVSGFETQPTRPSFGAQPTQANFGVPSLFGQNRFGSQSTSFTGAQGTSPTKSSFAGQGEIFDASRKPPASGFDSETGYHY